MGARDEADHPFLAEERRLLADAEQGVPVLGICLGAQILARALGATVKGGGSPEIGWLDVAPTPAADGDPLLGHSEAPTGVFQWHLDAFDLPEGAVHLATSAQYPNQAFRLGEAWGVQFHPEWTTSSSRSGSVTTPEQPRLAASTRRRSGTTSGTARPSRAPMRSGRGSSTRFWSGRPRWLAGRCAAAYALVAADEDASAAGPRPHAAAACAACRRSDRRTSSRIARGGRSRSGATPVELLLAMPPGEVVMRDRGCRTGEPTATRASPGARRRRFRPAEEDRQGSEEVLPLEDRGDREEHGDRQDCEHDGPCSSGARVVFPEGEELMRSSSAAITPMMVASIEERPSRLSTRP